MIHSPVVKAPGLVTVYAFWYGNHSFWTNWRSRQPDQPLPPPLRLPRSVRGLPDFCREFQPAVRNRTELARF
eukprot:795202-Rhodomonas_salina.1